jgi:bifunctional non-homologous end joining protein LigD
MSTRLSNPDKVLWPEAGFTKQDLWDYVERAADRLLPHLAERPLTLKRYPSGVHRQGFFQKDLPDHAPAGIARFTAWSEASRRDVAYAVAGDVEDLRWFAQMNTVELHPWFSRVDRPDRPDLLGFDLDPGAPTQSVVDAARWLREVLDALGLDSMVKTSGKRGLHVYVPVERRYGFGELRAFGLAVARAVAARHPDRLTVEMRKANRGDRLLLDWSRVGPGQTLVAAWSPRAHPAGTVSTPLRWDEVTSGLDPTAFTLATALDRDDPWAAPPPFQRIERARAALAEQGFDAEDLSPRSSRTVEERLRTRR